MLLLEVDVGEVEADRLGAAEAGGVDELEQGAVAEREQLCSLAPSRVEAREQARRPPPASARPAGAADGAARAGSPARARGRARSGAASAPRTSRRAIVAGASLPPGRARPRSAVYSDSARTSTRSSRPSLAVPLGEVAEVGPVGAAGRVGDARRREKALDLVREGHAHRVRGTRYDRLPRWTTASTPSPSSPSTAPTCSPVRCVAVGATTRPGELARAVAEAAYERGALFVDVAYFDPYVKRARIEHADPETLAFVPPWYGERRLEQLAERGDARIALAGVVDPDVFDGLDPALLGRDQLPGLKETSRDRRRAVDELDDRAVPASRPGPSSSTPSSTRRPRYERLWDGAHARAAARRARPGGGMGRARRRARALGRRR